MMGRRAVGQPWAEAFATLGGGRRRRLPAEMPWLGGVWSWRSSPPSSAPRFRPANRSATRFSELDGLLLYGGFALGGVLPILSGWNSKDLPRRSNAWMRVIVGDGRVLEFTIASVGLMLIACYCASGTPEPRAQTLTYSGHPARASPHDHVPFSTRTDQCYWFS